jgi:hypothetical protein
MTRGERNNNPGNIRRLSGVSWVGQAADQSTDAAFVVFTSPIYGIRAIARILTSYARERLNTVQAVIDRWAPPNENNSKAYVDAVCRDCGVLSTDVIDVVARRDDLIKAIIEHENGEQIYTDVQIETGIQLADSQ